MKTFRQFQEAAFAPAIPAAAGFITKFGVPAAAAIVGGVGTYLQTKKSGSGDGVRRQYKTRNNPNVRKNKNKRNISDTEKKVYDLEKKKSSHLRDTGDKPPITTINPKKGEVENTEKLINKYKQTNKVIKPTYGKEGEILKQRELIKKAEKEITSPKVGEKKDASRTVKNFLKARKKEGETMYKLKQDAEIADKGPGDLLPDAKKTYLNKLLSNLRRQRNIPEEAVAPVNNVGDGKIAGTVEAGDDPPVKKKKKKKKRYIYGGRGSRKMWMNNK